MKNRTENADARLMLNRIGAALSKRLNDPHCDLRTLAEQTRQTAELVLATITEAEQRRSGEEAA